MVGTVDARRARHACCGALHYYPLCSVACLSQSRHEGGCCSKKRPLGRAVCYSCLPCALQTGPRSRRVYPSARPAQRRILSLACQSPFPRMCWGTGRVVGSMKATAGHRTALENNKHASAPDLPNLAPRPWDSHGWPSQHDSTGQDHANYEKHSKCPDCRS